MIKPDKSQLQCNKIHFGKNTGSVYILPLSISFYLSFYHIQFDSHHRALFPTQQTPRPSLDPTCVKPPSADPLEPSWNEVSRLPAATAVAALPDLKPSACTILTLALASAKVGQAAFIRSVGAAAGNGTVPPACGVLIPLICCWGGGGGGCMALKGGGGGGGWAEPKTWQAVPGPNRTVA